MFESSVPQQHRTHTCCCCWNQYGLFTLGKKCFQEFHQQAQRPTCELLGMDRTGTPLLCRISVGYILKVLTNWQLMKQLGTPPPSEIFSFLKFSFFPFFLGLFFVSNFLLIFIYFMSFECFACLYLCIPHACLVSVGIRRGHWIPGSLSYRWLWALV